MSVVLEQVHHYLMFLNYTLERNGKDTEFIGLNQNSSNVALARDPEGASRRGVQKGRIEGASRRGV